MPIPENYRDICEMLLEASNAGRVNWVSQGGGFSVQLPQFSVEIWAGVDESGSRFVALGLKEREAKGLLDNWWVEDGDQDYDMLQALHLSAKRCTSGIQEKLEELRTVLKKKDKVG